MQIEDLDLDSEWERLRAILLLLSIQLPRETLEIWRERAARGKPPFPVGGLIGLQQWATTILEHDEPTNPPNLT